MKETILPPIEGYEEAKTLEEMIDILGREILDRAFDTIKKIKRVGKKVAQKDIDIQEELQRQFRYIQTTYSSLKKMNRIGETAGSNFSSEFMDRIKNKPSTVGAIVTRIDKKVG